MESSRRAPGDGPASVPGTVEEKIVEPQARKARLAAAIFLEKGGGTARFAVEDVERLFAPLGAGLD
jgi:hypothetical protein